MLHSGKEVRRRNQETLEGPGPQELLEDLVVGREWLLHWRGGQLLCGWGQLQGKQPQTQLRGGAGKGTGRAGGLLQALQVHSNPTLRSPPKTLDST